VSWSTFEAADPGLAAEGRRLLDGERGPVLLATVRDDLPPRIHPISAAIVGGGLYAFILASAKRVDLESDGRYALHAHLDPDAPDEFLVRGRANLVEDASIRASVGRDWSFEVDETYALYELGVDAVVLGARPTADDWPPRYRTWTRSG
jgi:hypothetical protein